MKLNTSVHNSFEINEEMEGWIDLVKKLPLYLKGCKGFDEWFLKVSQIPFAENKISIYERED